MHVYIGSDGSTLMKFGLGSVSKMSPDTSTLILKSFRYSHFHISNGKRQFSKYLYKSSKYLWSFPL